MSPTLGPGTSNWGTHGESHVVDGSPADLVVHAANTAQARICGLFSGGEIEGRIRGELGPVSAARNQRYRRTADGVFQRHRDPEPEHRNSKAV